MLLPTTVDDQAPVTMDWTRNLTLDRPHRRMFRSENGPPPRSIVREVNFIDNEWFRPTRSRRWSKIAGDIDKFNHIRSNAANPKRAASPRTGARKYLVGVTSALRGLWL